MPTILRITLGTILMMMLALFAGCCSVPVSSDELPPVLSQEELIRPYDKLGRIQVTREVYLFNQSPSNAEAYAWGYQVIREEAAKMQADAVILLEVNGLSATPGMLPTVMPSTEYRATGVAIKFK